jgi:dUTP pyrophosphatase
MNVKFKKLHPEAIVPSKAYPGDAGLDMTAISKTIDLKGNLVMGTGLAIAIPDNHVGLIFPRSSIANKKMSLTNSVGVIDSKFRGEILFKFKPANTGVGRYEVGDKVGQLIIMPYPEVNLVEVGDLEETVRGEGSFGSSDDEINEEKEA